MFVPPFLDDIVKEHARQGCLLGDPSACKLFEDLGGKVEDPFQCKI